LPEPELEASDPAPELLLPDDAVTVADPEAVLAAVVVAVLAVEVASAGSFPVANCTKIPPEVARNIVVAMAATRRRICETRRLRACSWSDTRPAAAGLDAGRRAERNGNALVEASGGVIVYLLVIVRRTATTQESRRLIAMPCDADKEVV
jgi:hypothetical protein